MLYEKHMIMRTHPNLKSSQNMFQEQAFNNMMSYGGMMPMMAIPPNMMGYSQEDHDEDDY